MSTLFEDGRDSGALFSQCRRYRYRLWRIWNDHMPVMTWVLLNPSTADEVEDDPTMRKCMGFAKRNRFGGIVVVNIFAWRSTDPSVLPDVDEPVGPDNDAHIVWAVTAPVLGKTVAGWGGDTFARRRAQDVRMLLAGIGRPLHCFGRTQYDEPRHPLYLGYSRKMERL